MSKKLISVVTPCYNEQDNVEFSYTEVKDIFARLGKYEYEHIFIDNDSQDKTVSILEQISLTRNWRCGYFSLRRLSRSSRTNRRFFRKMGGRLSSC
jgi:glycosyltransferase involved in cell wall biosynthesis